MIVLGIESSCDETSVALVSDGRIVLSCETASSLSTFAGMGGVIPEYAARAQVESIIPVLRNALDAASLSICDVDLIAVTHGPGLLGSLLVGTVTARILASVHAIPLLPIHHTLGHLSSVWLNSDDDAPPPHFPSLTLSVSGGHTDLWFRTGHRTGIRLGRTLDDAAGEAFDKGAVLLGLPYPGGPALAALASRGDEQAYSFPDPLSRESGTDFSFSGLKTSLKYLLRDLGASADIPSVAASYQLAICRHLVSRLLKASEAHPSVRELHIVGGVAANERLRSLVRASFSPSMALRCPMQRYCTDNAAMIASAGYFLWKEGCRPHDFRTEATLPECLDESFRT